MREVTVDQLVEILSRLGLRAGDGILVHSALQFLGRPQNGLQTYLHALSQVINLPPDEYSAFDPLEPKGTLAVPAFNFAFAQGEVYDPTTTTSQGMGVFSEFVRKQPLAVRTLHPMQSLALLGAHALEIANRDTPGAFDPGSAFERLLELDFKILLLGCDIQAVSLLHYSEQRIGVPYRFWKEFTGQVRTEQGWEARTYLMWARDMRIDARLEIYPIQGLLVERRQWRSEPLNYGHVSVFRALDFVAATDDLLAKDPWVFVTGRSDKVNES